jgi:deoxyhypusine synthase
MLSASRVVSVITLSEQASGGGAGAPLRERKSWNNVGAAQGRFETRNRNRSNDLD